MLVYGRLVRWFRRVLCLLLPTTRRCWLCAAPSHSPRWYLVHRLRY